MPTDPVDVIYEALAAYGLINSCPTTETYGTPHEFESGHVAEIAEAVAAALDQHRPGWRTAATGGWSWTPPVEPGPEVRRVRPVERYPGDNGTWYDREPDNSGWRLVMRGRRGGVIEWLAVVAGTGGVYGGRTLVDATAELQAEAEADRG